MAELSISNATTAGLNTATKDFSVNYEQLDKSENKEYWYDFNEHANERLGYYKQIPELKSALIALARWTTGLGYTTNNNTRIQLENFTGWGEDTFTSIMQNLIIQKKVYGDAFAEIIRNEQGRIINLKPLDPADMRVYVNGKGMILRYEQRNRGYTNKPITFKTTDILHLCNNRLGNEIHGISIIESLKFIIDAKNEALSDERKIRHRELALGILEVDTDDTTEISAMKTQYQNSVKNGDVLVLPKGVAEIKDSPNSPRDRLQWLQYLDSLFYQVVGIPKVIVTSEGFTEAGGKVGFLTFEPVYTAEQAELEADLWNQCAIRVTFNRPPSLSGTLREEEEKNTGQIRIQPNETSISARRTE